MDIQVSYDSTTAAAPSWLQSAVNTVIAKYDALITDPISLSLSFSWGQENGNAIRAGATAQNQSNGTYMSFGDLTKAMKAHATTAADAAAVASLPAADPTNGGKFYVPLALQKALGVQGKTPGMFDGYIGLSSGLPFTYSPSGQIASGTYDVVSVIEHEVSEVLGRVGFLGGSKTPGVYGPMDLFRYTGPGQRDLVAGSGAFSIDGQTMLKQFNNPLTGGDAADWSASTLGDTFGNTSAGIASTFSSVDMTLLDVLGYTLSNPAPQAPAPQVPAPKAPQATFSSTVSFSNAGTVNISGTLSDPRGHVEVFADGDDLGAATLASDGTWKLQAALSTDYVGSLSAVVTGSNGVSAAVDAPFTLIGSLRSASGSSALAASVGGANYLQYSVTQHDNGTSTYDYKGGSFFKRAKYSRDTYLFSDDGTALSETKTLKGGGHQVSALADGQTIRALGNDTMAAYGSNDTFVFSLHPGQETITDFAATGGGHDVISLSSASFSSIADVLQNLKSSGNDTVITLSASDSITIHNVSVASLKANPGDFKLHG